MFRRFLPLPPMILFAMATLTPVALLGAGVWLGGAWVLPGLLYMAVLTIVLDRLIRWTAPDAPEGAEFPAADALLAAIGIAHLIGFPVAVWAIAGESGLSPLARIGLFAGFGLVFGQISNPAAHELIHRGNRWLYRLGVALYATMLNAHHASAHRLVHHRHVATPMDPNSAPQGMGFYRFLLRAYLGSFRAGWQAETARRAGGAGGLHPYPAYLLAQAGSLALGFWIAGWAGLLVWLALAAHATAQLMLSDYVQHYGLVRRQLADGRYEPVSARHSWNAPHWFTSGVMLNAPRHSDHHAHPTRPYPALRLPEADAAPWLPWSLPVASAVALVPALWHRRMRHRLRRWTAASTTSGLD